MTAKMPMRTSAQATRICRARINKANRFLLKSKTGDIKNTMSNIEFAATAVIEEIHNKYEFLSKTHLSYLAADWLGVGAGGIYRAACQS